jgi:carbonic anhydrase
MPTIDELVDNAQSYAETFDRGELPLPPAKRVAIVACMDARLNPYDVRQSIARIKASPFIPRKEQIRGFVYDVHNGRLREVT